MGERISDVRFVPFSGSPDRMTRSANLPTSIDPLDWSGRSIHGGVNGDVIARCLGRLLEVVSKSQCGPDGNPPQTLVLVPPIMGDVSGTILEPLFDSAHSRKAIQRLREIARRDRRQIRARRPGAAGRSGARFSDSRQPRLDRESRKSSRPFLHHEQRPRGAPEEIRRRLSISRRGTLQHP
jgi:hypothetical protein